MKKNIRFVVAVVLLATVAALGFSRGAWAGPLTQIGTVPECPSSDSESGLFFVLDTCYAHASVVSYSNLIATVTMVDGISDSYPMVTLSVEGQGQVFITLCFFDPTGTSIIQRQYGSLWQTSPSYRILGQVCTLTYGPGTFRVKN